LEYPSRDGAFLEIFRISPESPFQANNPLVLYDLNRDGFSEVILPAMNMIVRNRGNGSFEKEDLFPTPLANVASAYVGDFTGDSEPDLIIAPLLEMPLLFAGKNGAFDPQSTPIHIEKRPAPYPGSINTITAGDIDLDGDLDLFFGQYKNPNMDGDMPPKPYYDARDNQPAYLLQNDGRGDFTDIALDAGLGAKGGRRTISASLVDLDGDRDLDLLTVNDFAGVDVYSNDGLGKFTDVTATALDQPAAFGRSHALADFNQDGRLDLFVTGVSSDTARRLSKMGVSVDDFK